MAEERHPPVAAEAAADVCRLGRLGSNDNGGRRHECQRPPKQR
jgi:hypothetical protein